MIWDGSRITWSTKDHQEIRAMVDLDADEGRLSRDGKNTFRLNIRQTRIIQPSII